MYQCINVSCLYVLLLIAQVDIIVLLHEKPWSKLVSDWFIRLYSAIEVLFAFTYPYLPLTCFAAAICESEAPTWQPSQQYESAFGSTRCLLQIYKCWLSIWKEATRLAHSLKTTIPHSPRYPSTSHAIVSSCSAWKVKQLMRSDALGSQAAEPKRQWSCPRNCNIYAISSSCKSYSRYPALLHHLAMLLRETFTKDTRIAPLNKRWQVVPFGSSEAGQRLRRVSLR